jgi:hypothetical protein
MPDAETIVLRKNVIGGKSYAVTAFCLPSSSAFAG